MAGGYKVELAGFFGRNLGSESSFHPVGHDIGVFHSLYLFAPVVFPPVQR